MNKKRPAGEQIQTIDYKLRKQAEATPFCELLLLFILQLSEEFEENPQITFDESRRSIWILYPDMRLDALNFEEAYGTEAAQLSVYASVRMYGMSGTMDLGEMEFDFRDETTVRVCQQNSVGHPFQEIDGVGIRIFLPEEYHFDAYRELLQCLDYRKLCIAAEKSCLRKVGRMDAFPVIEQDMHFGYLIMNECSCYLLPEFLSMEQKKRLWLIFLQRDVSPMEFAYINEALTQGLEVSVFSWAIALEMAMEEAGVKIEYLNKEFRILDKQGKRRWYSHQSSLEAEKLFMKLLFPAVPLDSLH